MRLLLDESVPRQFRRALARHTVGTVVEMGWRGIRNGTLLNLAATRFDAFVTVDANLQYQQNAASLPISVVILLAPSNTLSALLPLTAELEHVLMHLPRRTLVTVGESQRLREPVAGRA